MTQDMGHGKILRTVNLCKNLRNCLKYRNPNLTLAESAKSTLQILVKFD